MGRYQSKETSLHGSLAFLYVMRAKGLTLFWTIFSRMFVISLGRQSVSLQSIEQVCFQQACLLLVIKDSDFLSSDSFPVMHPMLVQMSSYFRCITLWKSGLREPLCMLILWLSVLLQVINFPSSLAQESLSLPTSMKQKRANLLAYK